MRVYVQAHVHERPRQLDLRHQNKSFLTPGNACQGGKLFGKNISCNAHCFDGRHTHSRVPG